MKRPGWIGQSIEKIKRWHERQQIEGRLNRWRVIVASTAVAVLVLLFLPAIFEVFEWADEHPGAALLLSAFIAMSAALVAAWPQLMQAQLARREYQLRIAPRPVLQGIAKLIYAHNRGSSGSYIYTKDRPEDNLISFRWKIKNCGVFPLDVTDVETRVKYPGQKEYLQVERVSYRITIPPGDTWDPFGVRGHLQCQILKAPRLETLGNPLDMIEDLECEATVTYVDESGSNLYEKATFTLNLEIPEVDASV